MHLGAIFGSYIVRFSISFPWFKKGKRRSKAMHRKFPEILSEEPLWKPLAVDIIAVVMSVWGGLFLMREMHWVRFYLPAQSFHNTHSFPLNKSIEHCFCGNADWAFCCKRLCWPKPQHGQLTIELKFLTIPKRTKFIFFFFFSVHIQGNVCPFYFYNKFMYFLNELCENTLYYDQMWDKPECQINRKEL